MAYIQKRGDTYRIRVFVSEDKTGRQLEKSKTYKPKAKSPRAIEKEVQKAAIEFEKKVLNGEYYEGEKLTYNAVYKEWLELWAPHNLTLGIMQGYCQMIEARALPVIGTMKISAIRGGHIQSIVQTMIDEGKSVATMKRCICAINSVFRYAEHMEFIDRSPCDKVRYPKRTAKKAEKKIQYFTVEQAEAFLESLDRPYEVSCRAHDRVDDTGKKYSVPGYTMTKRNSTQFKVLFTLAIYGGFRRGELIGLTWNDIDFENCLITIDKAAARVKGAQIMKEPKTAESNRTISISKNCLPVLRKWKLEEMEMCMRLGTAWEGPRGKDFDSNYIFITDTGRQMSIYTPYQKLKDCIDRYNEGKKEEDQLPDIRFHDLRHTSATLLIEAGTDIETVSRRLGHSKASITLDIYGHATEKADRTAADTLDRLFTAKRA